MADASFPQESKILLLQVSLLDAIYGAAYLSNLKVFNFLHRMKASDYNQTLNEQYGESVLSFWILNSF